MNYDLVIVGHIVLDYIRRTGSARGPYPGGPCVYAGSSAAAIDASVAVVSKVGRDFGRKRLSWLRRRGVAIDRVRVAHCSTTSFEISYHNEGRKMRVRSVCDPLGSEDLTDFPDSKAIHIGPILNEITPSLATSLARRGAILSLDPQGYVRTFTPNGEVRIKRRWRNSSLLNKLTILKVSREELQSTIGASGSINRLSKLGPEIVLLTEGRRGTTVWSRDNGAFSAPAFKTQVRDPTGAGDALVAAFTVTWLRTKDILWSVAVGSAVASFVVTRFGPQCFGTHRQIDDRANSILDTIKRV